MGSKGNKTKKAQAKKQHKALLRRRKHKESLRTRNIRRNSSKSKTAQGASMDEAMAKAMEEFASSGEALWWVANGINCFQSDYDEGIWSPPFPEIYEEGHTLNNEIVRNWLTQHFNEEDSSWTDEGRHAAGLVMSPVPVLLVISHKCKDAAALAQEEGEAEVDPYSAACEPVWKVFDEMKKEIIAREEKNAEEAAKAAEEAVDDTPSDTDAVSDEVVETPAKTAENEQATTEAVES